MDIFEGLIIVGGLVAFVLWLVYYYRKEKREIDQLDPDLEKLVENIRNKEAQRTENTTIEIEVCDEKGALLTKETLNACDDFEVYEDEGRLKVGVGKKVSRDWQFELVVPKDFKGIITVNQTYKEPLKAKKATNEAG